MSNTQTAQRLACPSGEALEKSPRRPPGFR